MNKFIARIFLFFIFSGLFYVITLCVWGYCIHPIFKPNLIYLLGAYGHTYSRLSEVKQVKNIDILFLGSSRAYRGFDTRIFSNHGFKSFNLGSSAQTPIQTYLLLNRYLEKLHPKLVIYEVDPSIFMTDGVESALDIVSNDKNDKFSLKMVLEINNIKVYNTFIYALFRDLFDLNKSFSEPIIKDKDIYINGGYVEQKIEYYKPIDSDKQKISINQNQLRYFSKIVSELKNKNINLILVTAPVPSTTYNSYSNYNYFDSIMRKYSDYYDFNKIMTLNDSLSFYDYSHLNQYGVNLFNLKLIEIINSKYRHYLK